jgi:hypothetical protein
MLQLNYHEATNQIEKVINNNLNKNRLKITKLEEEINGHKRALNNKDYGDLLFTYAYLGKIVKNEFIYEDENIKIPIDPSISIFDNGKKYFAKYSKAKKAIPFIEEQIEIASEELEVLAKDQLLPVLTDTQAYTFRYLFPTFEIDKSYEVGERIIYEDKFYKVITTHTSQADWTPDVAVSLFVEISDPAIEYPEFKKPYSAETAYMKGDKITFEGNKYVSTMDNNVYSPTEYPQGWEAI